MAYAEAVEPGLLTRINRWPSSAVIPKSKAVSHKTARAMEFVLNPSTPADDLYMPSVATVEPETLTAPPEISPDILNELIVDPNAAEVEPRLMDEFVSDELPMLVSVLLEPLIVLFIRVWVPVRVATVESIATVTAAEPLYEVPDKPVPIVNAFGLDAVTVVEPPKLTEFPLIVMALLVSELLPILDSVFVAPLMLLFVSVCVPVRVATVESIANVTGEEPLKDPPDNPVPEDIELAT